MNKTKTNPLGLIALFLAAAIWGFAFSAQRTASGSLGPFAVNGARYILALVFLCIVYLIYELICKKKGKKLIPWNKDTILGGILTGIILFIGTNLQQAGISNSGAGKTAFITTLYIVMVPIVAMLTRKKPSVLSMFAILMAVIGFYLMCITGVEEVSTSDLIVLLCALVFTFHILFTDLFSKYTDPIKYTLMQFITAAILSIPAMAIEGFPSSYELSVNMVALLYVGICSSGLGFTFQTVGQKYVEPSLASLVMSLESVFGLIGGILLLNETSTTRELLGCLFVFIGVFMAQVTIPKTFLKFSRNKYFIEYN